MPSQYQFSEDFLSPKSNWEAAEVGVNAPFLQRGRYYSPDGGSPIRTVIPPSERKTMTQQELIQAQEQEVEQLTKEAQLSGAILQQKIAAADQMYKVNTIKQSEDLLHRFGELRPDESDYPVKRAQLQSEYPLAWQNQSILRQVEQLDRTHDQLNQNNQILDRSRILAEEADRRQNIDQARGIVAKYGSRALAQFEEHLAKDPNSSPLGIVANMVDAQDEQDTVANLRGMGVSENQIKKFYTPEVSINGRPSGNSRFNAKAAKEYIEKMPTTANVDRAIALKNKLRDRNEGTPFNEWDPDDQVEWNLLNNRLRSYQASIGETPEEPKQGEKPNTPNASLLFGK